MVTEKSMSASIRESLDHPIIDADAHVLEVLPVFLDFVRQVAGPGMRDRYATVFENTASFAPNHPWFSMTDEERRDARSLSPMWWPRSGNTLDRATASLPKLLYERLDELGIDFAVLYPTHVFSILGYDDEEMRRAGARAFNTYRSDMFRGYEDRMTAACLIPMHTPQEAVEELEHAVNVLGFKTAVIPGYVKRPIPKVHREHPGLGPHAFWADTFGIDSEYDYDPFWAKCVELGVAPAQHLGGYGMGHRVSVNNFMFNSTGNFAAANEGLCKSLFMAGVTRRFPELHIALLESGVGWACALYGDMVSRWQKRNPEAVLRHLDPDLLDHEQLADLFSRYGDERVTGKLEEIAADLLVQQPRMAQLDDWAACEIDRVEQVRELFEPNFFFGCEGDDPLNAWAFKNEVNPLGARLRAVFGSDIGHWDVPDMREVVEEAYEPVERGLITPDDFREFVFTNAVRLHGGPNPNFFNGTRVEAAVDRLHSGVA